MSNQANLSPVRISHQLKRRQLQVKKVEQLSPAMVRITFTGDDLADFKSSSFDDHVKIFFPESATEQVTLPAEGERMSALARDYTPRRYDVINQELDIDFVLHDAGPATTWAAQAKIGQSLVIGGPRGSFVIPTAFDWHVLIGDETALPAISRRLEELPIGTKAIVVLQVTDASHEMALTTDADLELTWCYRDGATAGNDPLLQVIQNLVLPSGEGYIWAAGESSLIRSVRQYCRFERGIEKERIRTASYWRRGAVASHESFDD